MSIDGKFEFYKQENGKDFYLAVGTSPEFAEKSETTACTLEVVHYGNNIKIYTHYVGKIKVDCVVGQSFTDKMPNGMVLDSIATIDANKIVIKSTKDGAYIGKRVYEFVGDEVIVSISAVMTPVVCKRYYKKCNK